MRKLIVLALLAAGCGGTDDLGAVEACHQLKDATCDRIFACYSPQMLQEFQSEIGKTAAECKVMLKAEDCKPVDANCQTDETYHPDKAFACVSATREQMCSDVVKPEVPAPVVCGEVCTK
jgi:hypothetical protein